MKAITKFLEVMDKPNSQLTFREKFRKLRGVILVSIISFFLALIFAKVHNIRKVKEEKRNKLKYFKPTIEEGLFFNRTSWTMRDKPLTDEQLDTFLKDNK